MEKQLKIKDGDCFLCICIREEIKRKVEITTIKAFRKCAVGPSNCQEIVLEPETVITMPPSLPHTPLKASKHLLELHNAGEKSEIRNRERQTEEPKGRNVTEHVLCHDII